MTLNLTRRSVKGSELTATDHDTNLDKLEDGIEARALLTHVGSGGTAHANAVAAGAAGFMTGADKTKLDGIATGATANASNADLRDRSTHTGTQAAGTITGLGTAATANTGTGAGNVVVLDGSARLPAVDGSLLTGLGGGGNAQTANPLSQFAATTSAQLAGVISDETGSGALVFASSPTLVTPALGTPASGTLTNCTSLPAAGVTGLGSLATQSATLPAGAIVGTTDAQTLTNKTLGNLTETVFTITDGAGFEIDPANGPIQLVTLGANRTPAATNFSAGESMMLMVNDGSAFSITWTTAAIVWVGGTAPTLATTGFTVLEFWRVGSTTYGARVGAVA